MKKIAVINDLSGLGKCSLTAAIPVISVMGVQACPLPTAVLSNQTGYPSYFCDDYTDRMEAIMEEWKKREFHPDGIYTGFLADEAQVDKIFRFLEDFSDENTMLLVDPVMGDQGRTYGIYTNALCEKMRTLVNRATVITPNLTEALLLLHGKEGLEETCRELSQLPQKRYQEELEKIGKQLTESFQMEMAVITGLDHRHEDGSSDMGNLLLEKGKSSWVWAGKEGGSYSGTGDLFASVLSAGLVSGESLEHCVKKAVRFLSKSIHDAVREGRDRNDGVCFEKYLNELWEEPEH